MVNAKQVFCCNGHAAAVYTLSPGINPGTIISGSGDKFIAQWHILDGKQDKFSAKMPSSVFSLLLIPELHQLWVGTASGVVHVLDIKLNCEVHAFSFHKSQVFCIAQSSVDGLIYTCAGDGTLAVFDAERLKNLAFQQVSQNKLRSIDFFQDKLLLAEGSGKSIFINSASLQTSSVFSSDDFATNCHLFTKDNGRLISGGRDAQLRVWDIDQNFNLIKKIPAHNFAIYRIIELPGKNLVVTASRDKTIKLWDTDFHPLLRINRENFNGHSHSVNALIWLEQEQLLVSAGDDRTIMGWQLKLD